MTGRRLLSRARAAAAGLVVAGALSQREIRQAKASSPVRHAINAPSIVGARGAFEGTNEGQGYGVWGNSNGYGVYGTGVLDGVVGMYSFSSDVYGENDLEGGVGVRGRGRLYGVMGRSSGQNSVAVRGWHSSLGTGVRGECAAGTGVEGRGNIGVKGTSGASSLGAVEGHNSGGGPGVKGTGAAGVKGDSNTAGRGAVEGSMENDAGYGVWGNSWGIGVRGTGSTDGVHGIGTNGYGGQFDGSKAQLRLVPGSSLGSPTTGAHKKGELYMDSGATLWVCVADGSPGAWEQISIVG
jgi:hypothetical protein